MSELVPFSPEMERRMNQEEHEYLTKMLGSLGFYSAALDQLSTPPHPDDDKWIELSNN